MATVQQTGSVDLAAQLKAGQTATNYITDVSNDGIWVTPNDAKPSNGTAVSTTTGWYISNVLEYFKSGASWIKLWVQSGIAKFRLGLENSAHAVFDSDGMEVFASGSLSAAKIGPTARIGQEVLGHVTLSNDGFDYSYGDNSLFAIEPVEGAKYTITTTLVSESFTCQASESIRWPSDFEYGGAINNYPVNVTLSGATSTSPNAVLLYEVDGTYQAVPIYNQSSEVPSGTTIYTLGFQVKKLYTYAGQETGTYGYGFELYINNSSGTSAISGTVALALAAPEVTSVVARVGKSDESHMELDYHSLQMINRDNRTYFHVSDLRDSQGMCDVVDEFPQIEGYDNFYDLTVAPPESGTHSITVEVIGPNGEDLTSTYNVITSYRVWIANGYIQRVYVKDSDNNKPPLGSVIRISYTTASAAGNAFTLGRRLADRGIGQFSYCEGWMNVASGSASHAENIENEVTGPYSHAEGCWNKVYGRYSHAEGALNKVYGLGSHVGGNNSNVLGSMAFSHGSFLLASKRNQVVFGKYNVEDTNTSNNFGNYAFIIGNGTSDSNRSNALEITWDGATVHKVSPDSSKPSRSDSAPAANIALHGMYHEDKNGTQVGYSEIFKTTTNQMYRSFAVTNETDNGDAVTTGLYLFANRDGTRAASLTSGTTWPVANGGTGATTAAGARANLGAMGASNYNGYWGLAFPNGNTNSWVRTSQSGLIPYASGGNSSSLGTSSWPFTNVYAQNFYSNGVDIGHYYSNSKSDITRSAGIDNHVLGPGITIPAGKYVIVAKWVFNTRAGSTSTNLQCSIGTGTSGIWGYQRINVYGNGYTVLTYSHISNITSSSTTLYCIGSASTATQSSAKDSASIVAVKIA